jgi:dipeptidyl aminopeptidase/acylaminoacyl peptidase
MRRRYGPRPDQFADLHLPAGAGPFPVAVLLHGGFYRERHTLELMDGLAADLVRRGWAAWNLEFRRVGEASGGGWPQTLEDVAAGVDALAGLDSRLVLAQVVAIGHSAGGQLALWAAARRDATVRIAGVVAQAGLLDLRTAERDPDGEGAVAIFMGGPAADRPDRYADASPIERLPIGVPQLLVHGDADVRVPVDTSRRYAAAARAAGDEVELVVRPGEDHFVHLDPAGGAWADVTGWLGRFAARVGA